MGKITLNIFVEISKKKHICNHSIASSEKYYCAHSWKKNTLAGKISSIHKPVDTPSNSFNVKTSFISFKDLNKCHSKYFAFYRAIKLLRQQ